MKIAQMLPSGKILTIEFRYQDVSQILAMANVRNFMSRNNIKGAIEEAYSMVDELDEKILADPHIRCISVLEPKKTKWVPAVEIDEKDLISIQDAKNSLPSIEYTPDQAKQAIFDYYEPLF